MEFHPAKIFEWRKQPKGKQRWMVLVKIYTQFVWTANCEHWMWNFVCLINLSCLPNDMLLVCCPLFHVYVSFILIEMAKQRHQPAFRKFNCELTKKQINKPNRTISEYEIKIKSNGKKFFKRFYFVAENTMKKKIKNQKEKQK